MRSGARRPRQSEACAAPRRPGRLRRLDDRPGPKRRALRLWVCGEGSARNGPETSTTAAVGQTRPIDLNASGGGRVRRETRAGGARMHAGTRARRTGRWHACTQGRTVKTGPGPLCKQRTCRVQQFPVAISNSDLVGAFNAGPVSVEAGGNLVKASPSEAPDQSMTKQARACACGQDGVVVADSRSYFGAVSLG